MKGKHAKGYKKGMLPKKKGTPKSMRAKVGAKKTTKRGGKY